MVKASQKNKALLAQKDVKIAELTDHLKRLAAEFDNYQKRVIRERADLELLAKAKVLSTVITLKDDLQRTLNASEKSDTKTLTAGVEMILKQLQKSLEAEGVTPMSVIGKKFDPHMHEVILQVEADAEPGTIVQEIEQGYVIGSRVLRYAKVGIAKPHKKSN